MKVVGRVLSIAAVFSACLLVAAAAWLYSALPSIASPPLLSYEDDLALDDPKRSGKKGSTGLLDAFGEVSLRSLRGPNSETYRLILIPTFENPVSIRIALKDGKPIATTKRLALTEDYEIGELIENTEWLLSASDWEQLKKSLDSSDFWMMPSIDHDEPLILDGTDCLIQAHNLGQVHNVRRIRPKGTLRELVMKMLAVSGNNDFSAYVDRGL